MSLDLLCCFLDRISCFCPGPASGHNPPIYASHVAGITVMNHHAQLIGRDGGLTNFLPELALNSDL
jgi:hypothetical protein